MNDLIKIMDELYDKTDQEKLSNVYEYNGKKLPRTTTILSSMLHVENLMSWANSLGFKRIGYRSYMNEASSKGTYSHNAIENFLKNGSGPDYEKIPELARETVYSTFHAFLSWWDIINKNNKVEIVYIEEKLTCKYFGGTLDCLLKINDKYWLIDFKTSNHMNSKYYLQLGAYAYMLLTERNINIDGCLVLKLDKSNQTFEEFLLNFDNEYDKKFFQDCIYEFLLLTAAYYGRLNIESKYENLNI